MLDHFTSTPYKRQTPDALVMHGWRSNQVRSSPAMAKRYFRSNYHEVKTQFEPPFDNCVCVPLSHGQHTLLYVDDFEKFIGHGMWAISTNGKKMYARSCSKINGRISFLHRLIIETPDDMLTDHINGKSLDNRRDNLRICSPSQNNQNLRKPYPNKYGYKGLTMEFGKYVAKIKYDNKKVHLGSFATAEEAALAYNEAALKYHGEFAVLNIIKRN